MPRNSDAATAPKRASRQRISPRLKEAIKLLASGECRTQRAAAARVGLSEVHLCNSLSKPHIGEFMTRQMTRDMVQASWRASRRFLELIDSRSDMVAAKVSDRVLVNAGLLKPEHGNAVNVAVNANVSVGYIIDATRRRDGMTPIAHSDASEPMPLIEQRAVRIEQDE